MLDEYSKKVLEFGYTQSAKMLGEFNELPRIGPSVLIDEAIDCCELADKVLVAKNLKENRKEAEQYLAGLMGMM